MAASATNGVRQLAMPIRVMVAADTGGHVAMCAVTMCAITGPEPAFLPLPHPP